MSKMMSESERVKISELVAIAQKLPAHERDHLLWIGHGILFASKANSDKK